MTINDDILSTSLRRSEFLRLISEGDYAELGLRFWIAFSFLHGRPKQLAAKKWSSLSLMDQWMCMNS